MKTLAEHVLLLEYDHDKTWARHGEAIKSRMQQDRHVQQGLEDSGMRPVWDKLYDHLAKDADPTPHREYGQWIARHYAGGGIKSAEDFGRVHQALSRFHEAKGRKLLQKHGVNPDINQHKGLPALEDAVDKIPQEEKLSDHPEPHEYTKYDDEHWTHVVPHTEKASQYYGRGTRWCTAAKEHCMFHNYDSEDDLHILIPKKPLYHGEKYQIHVSSGQIMNDRDEHPYMDERGEPRDNGRQIPEAIRHAARDSYMNSMHDGQDGEEVENVGDLASYIMEPHDYEPYAQSHHPYLRERAAHLGTKEHAQALFHDEDHDVRDTAKRHLDKIALQGE